MLALQNDPMFRRPVSGSSDEEIDQLRANIAEFDDSITRKTFAHADQQRSFANKNEVGADSWEDEIAFKLTKAKGRVEEILGRCQYLYSKRGLDLQSLIRDLKSEEAELEAAERTLHDRRYDAGKQKAESMYFGNPGGLLAIGQISNVTPKKEDLVLPPIDQSDDKRTKMEELLAKREARDMAEGEDEQSELNQDWMNQLDSMSSMIAEGLF
jgi:hypothetical protein